MYAIEMIVLYVLIQIELLSEMHVFGNSRCIQLQSSKYCGYFYFFDIPE